MEGMMNSSKHLGQKAMFLNFKEDGLKIRSNKFKNKKAYDRKAGKRVEF
jgi:hypothetical protein